MIAAHYGPAPTITKMSLDGFLLLLYCLTMQLLIFNFNELHEPLGAACITSTVCCY